jgi:hypothetical protein
MSATVPFPDDDFAAFEKRRGLGQRSCSRQEARQILGISEWQLDKLVAAGVLQPFQIGAKKFQFWVPDLVRLQWERRVHVPTAQSPPKADQNERGERGRPRKGTIHRIGGAS